MAETTTATCTEGGKTTCKAVFDDSWAKEQTKTVQSEALGHEWRVEYTWNDDNTACTANGTCKRDSSHTVTAEATVTKEVTTPETVTEDGVMTYTATFDESADWTWTQTKTAAIPAGHELTKVEAKSAACTEAGNCEYWTCGKCGQLFSDAEGNATTTLENVTIPATGHSYGSDYLCNVCGHEKEPAQDSETNKYQISDVREFIWFANLDEPPTCDSLHLSVADAVRAAPFVELLPSARRIRAVQPPPSNEGGFWRVRGVSMAGSSQQSANRRLCRTILSVRTPLRSPDTSP